MDINPFEVLGKTLRRTGETIGDSFTYVGQSFCDTFPRNLGFGRDLGRDLSDNIMISAYKALAHDDLPEARHQLNREIYFSSISDELTGSPDEKAAHAGLEALKRGWNSTEITDITVITQLKEKAIELEKVRAASQLQDLKQQKDREQQTLQLMQAIEMRERDLTFPAQQ
jgi:hypothetical protein